MNKDIQAVIQEVGNKIITNLINFYLSDDMDQGFQLIENFDLLLRKFNQIKVKSKLSNNELLFKDLIPIDYELLSIRLESGINYEESIYLSRYINQTCDSIIKLESLIDYKINRVLPYKYLSCYKYRRMENHYTR